MSLALSITRARTSVFAITVTQSGAALDLTGKKLIFSAKVKLSDADPGVFSKSSPSSGITIAGGSGGTATLTIDPSDTSGEALAPQRSLQWELVLIDGTHKYELNSGALNLIGNVIADAS